ALADLRWGGWLGPVDLVGDRLERQRQLAGRQGPRPRPPEPLIGRALLVVADAETAGPHGLGEGRLVLVGVDRVVTEGELALELLGVGRLGMLDRDAHAVDHDLVDL